MMAAFAQSVCMLAYSRFDVRQRLNEAFSSALCGLKMQAVHRGHRMEQEHAVGKQAVPEVD